MAQLTKGQVWYRTVYLKSEHWKTFRAEILRRRGERCERCNAHRMSERLEVHHLSYDRLWGELPEDVEVVCSLCHRMEHVTETDGQRRVYYRKERERRIQQLVESGADQDLYGDADYSGWLLDGIEGLDK